MTDTEKAADSVSNAASEGDTTSDDDDADYSNGVGGGGGCHHHNHNHNCVVIRHLLLLRRAVPEAWVLVIQDLVLGFCKFVHSVKWGKKMGRTIFGALIIMLVFSMFFKFSSMMGSNYYTEINGGKNSRRLNGLFTLQTWANAHQSVVLSETEEVSSSSSSAGDSLPKRVLEKFPVSLTI